MAQQTAVEWLQHQLYDVYNKEGKLPLAYTLDLVKQAKQKERERRKEDFKIGYNQGYLDAQLNHVNDADNLAEERDYLDDDPEIKGWTIGPFGTPEKS